MNQERLVWPRGLALYGVLAGWLTDGIQGGHYAVGYDAKARTSWLRGLRAA